MGHFLFSVIFPRIWEGTLLHRIRPKPGASLDPRPLVFQPSVTFNLIIIRAPNGF